MTFYEIDLVTTNGVVIWCGETESDHWWDIPLPSTALYGIPPGEYHIETRYTRRNLTIYAGTANPTS